MGNLTEVKFTDIQKEIVDFEGEELLIKGIPGSGKTLVLLEKARTVAEKHPDKKIAVFAYNKVLSNSSKMMLKQFNLNNLTVQTFHGWAYQNFSKITGNSCNLVEYNKDYLKKAINKLSQSNEHKFVQNDKYKNFIKEEITWIKGRGISAREEYIQVNRTGRGSEVRVLKTDREVIYDIYEAYQIEKDIKLDFDDLGYIISKYTDRIPDYVKYDYIFVDEAQDLQMVQLKSLKKLSKKVFVVAADKGQKIYKTSFTWKDIGINVIGGRTKVLKDSFRSTKQIVELALSLQKNDAIVNDDEFIMGRTPDKEGPKPVLIKSKSAKEQDYKILQDVMQIRKESPEATIGILAEYWRSLDRISRQLDNRKVEYQIIKKDNGNPKETGIKMTTFHSAKGLEFDFVIVIDLHDDNTDLKRDIDETVYWEYKRRLLYVAMTRAESVLRIYTMSDKSKLIDELDQKLYMAE
jgi:superfamily I DNA/RNA helicase